MTDPRFEYWLEDLQRRHLADLEFSEVTRALRALSARYVHHRTLIAERGALDTAGKRAAYAVYYSPLHFLTVRLVVESLPQTLPRGTTLVDLGCGAGAAGAAWGSSLAANVLGVDAHAWAIGEAPHAYRHFGLNFEMRRGHVVRTAIPRAAQAVVLGWVINELDHESRAALLAKLLEAAKGGVVILILEPIATRIAPWWAEWASAFESLGGRADDWRFPIELPDWLARLDRAAGMRHDELTARSIYIALQGTGRRARGAGHNVQGTGAHGAGHVRQTRTRVPTRFDGRVGELAWFRARYCFNVKVSSWSRSACVTELTTIR